MNVTLSLLALRYITLPLDVCAGLCIFTDEVSRRLPKRLNYCFSILASAMNRSIWLMYVTLSYPWMYVSSARDKDLLCGTDVDKHGMRTAAGNVVIRLASL